MEQLLSRATVDVLAERLRQIKVEGYTPDHDDAHTNGQLAKAASCCALAADTAIYEEDKKRPAWSGSYIPLSPYTGRGIGRCGSRRRSGATS